MRWLELLLQAVEQIKAIAGGMTEVPVFAREEFLTVVGALKRLEVVLELETPSVAVLENEGAEEDDGEDAEENDDNGEIEDGETEDGESVEVESGGETEAEDDDEAEAEDGEELEMARFEIAQLEEGQPYLWQFHYDESCLELFDKSCWGKYKAMLDDYARSLDASAPLAIDGLAKSYSVSNVTVYSIIAAAKLPPPHKFTRWKMEQAIKDHDATKLSWKEIVKRWNVNMLTLRKYRRKQYMPEEQDMAATSTAIGTLGAKICYQTAEQKWVFDKRAFLQSFAGKATAINIPAMAEALQECVTAMNETGGIPNRWAIADRHEIPIVQLTKQLNKWGLPVTPRRNVIRESLSRLERQLAEKGPLAESEVVEGRLFGDGGEGAKTEGAAVLRPEEEWPYPWPKYSYDKSIFESDKKIQRPDKHIMALDAYVKSLNMGDPIPPQPLGELFGLSVVTILSDIKKVGLPKGREFKLWKVEQAISEYEEALNAGKPARWTDLARKWILSVATLMSHWKKLAAGEEPLAVAEGDESAVDTEVEPEPEQQESVHKEVAAERQEEPAPLEAATEQRKWSFDAEAFWRNYFGNTTDGLTIVGALEEYVNILNETGEVPNRMEMATKYGVSPAVMTNHLTRQGIPVLKGEKKIVPPDKPKEGLVVPVRARPVAVARVEPVVEKVEPVAMEVEPVGVEVEPIAMEVEPTVSEEEPVVAEMPQPKAFDEGKRDADGKLLPVAARETHYHGIFSTITPPKLSEMCLSNIFIEIENRVFELTRGVHERARRWFMDTIIGGDQKLYLLEKLPNAVLAEMNGQFSHGAFMLLKAMHRGIYLMATNSEKHKKNLHQPERLACDFWLELAEAKKMAFVTGLK
jgi:hypothetical protein